MTSLWSRWLDVFSRFFLYSSQQCTHRWEGKSRGVCQEREGALWRESAESCGCRGESRTLGKQQRQGLCFVFLCVRIMLFTELGRIEVGCPRISFLNKIILISLCPWNFSFYSFFSVLGLHACQANIPLGYIPNPKIFYLFQSCAHKYILNLIKWHTIRYTNIY